MSDKGWKRIRHDNFFFNFNLVYKSKPAQKLSFYDKSHAKHLLNFGAFPRYVSNVLKLSNNEALERERRRQFSKDNFQSNSE